MKKWIIGSAIVATGTLVSLFFATTPTDRDLIRQAIEESTEASREGRPGGVLDYLSRSLTFNGMEVRVDRGEIAKYVRLSRPDITFGEFEPVIEGDLATIEADVRIKMDFQSRRLDETVPGVQVRLARESGLRWLVLPGDRWRITEVVAPDLAQFAQGMP